MTAKNVKNYELNRVFLLTPQIYKNKLNYQNNIVIFTLISKKHIITPSSVLPIAAEPIAAEPIADCCVASFGKPRTP